MVGIYMKSILVLILSRAVTGVAMGNAAVVSATIADLSDENSKAKNFGLYCMASGTGFALGPFLGGWLASIGFVVPFLFAGVATFINLALIFFLFEETHTVRKNATITMAEGIRNLKKAFKMHELRLLFLMVVFFCFGWSLFYEFLPVLWISDYGYSLAKVGLLFAFGSGVFALSSGVLIRPIVDHFRPHTILLYSLSLVGCFIFFSITQPPASWIWVYMAGVNFFVAIAFPTYTALVSNSVNKDSQGEILGILEAIQSTAFGIAPLFAGLLVGIHVHMPMVFGGGSLLLAALLVLHDKKKLRATP
jgi:MFS transporter, DHA1 family, tetracycline resistance protein